MNERCFAHRRNGKCVALTGEQCAGYAVCSFYKPIWKHAQDVARVNQRLNRLPIQKQRATSVEEALALLEEGEKSND